jgi:phage-related protein
VLPFFRAKPNSQKEGGEDSLAVRHTHHCALQTRHLALANLKMAIFAQTAEKVHEPYIKHLEGRLWEMRMKGRDGIAREIYVTAHERRVVVVRAFRQKTQKTPRREIAPALKRVEEVT